MAMNSIAELMSETIAAFGPKDVVLVALASWLGRVWASRIAAGDRKKVEADLADMRAQHKQDAQRLRAELDRTLIVHRTHLDLELSAYRDTWSSIAQVRVAMAGLRPRADIAPRGQTLDECRAERLPLLIHSHNELTRCVERNEPFLVEEIYSGLEEALRLSQFELAQVRTTATDSPEYFANGERNYRAFDAQTRRLAAAIRERLSHLAVAISGSEMVVR